MKVSALPVVCFGLLTMGGVLAFGSCALAQGTAPAVFQVATDQANSIFEASYTILQGLGMLSVLGLAGMAMTGRMPWGWAFALMAALILARIAVPMRGWVQQVATASAVTGKGNFSEVTATVKSGNMIIVGDVRDILYAFAGLMVACLAILSVFGRFQWKWLACVVGGLFLVGSTVNIVLDYTNPFPFGLPGALPNDQVGDALVGAELLTDRTARQGQYIIYGLGGVAILGLAAMAMMGRFSWNWFFATLGGLVLVAGVNLGIQYITGQSGVFEPQLNTN
jgi:hypothetical protein